MVRIGLTMMLAPLVCASIIVSGGCAKDEGTTLDREAFYRPPAGTRADRHVLQDQPGPLMYDNVRVDLLSPPQQGGPRVSLLNSDEGDEDLPPQESVTSVSEEVRRAVRLPRSAASTDASDEPNAASLTTAPSAARRPGVSSGVAMTVGAVVCEVNGQPIYADKVLAALSKQLSSEAKRLDERSFRKFAQKTITEQVELLKNTELAFAAAKRNLDPREQDLANAMTMKWRADQITQAGGSIERARARAAAEGLTFEELVQEKFRENMVLVYYQKRLFPRAQVRADDMRRFYERNLSTLFTEQAEAEFRVIRIDAAKTGGAAQAQEKIEHLRHRAERGEDFAELARTINDDPNLMRLAGSVGAVRQGSYAIEEVEQAVWKLQPGEVTPIIRVGDSFYIAKLASRKAGRVRPFEEEAVQEEITKMLRGEMLVQLRRRQEQALLQDAIVYPDPPDIGPVVEMAMQNYRTWASAGE